MSIELIFKENLLGNDHLRKIREEAQTLIGKALGMSK